MVYFRHGNNGISNDSRPMTTVDLLFEQSGMTIEDVAELAKLPVERVEAIVVGRWTPSPSDRQRIAGAFGVSPEGISWGHTMDPRNVRYRRQGFKDAGRGE